VHELLWERLRRDKKRPLLQVDDRRKELQELHAQRDPLYRELADIIIEGNGGSSPHLVEPLEREIHVRFAD